MKRLIGLIVALPLVGGAADAQDTQVKVAVEEVTVKGAFTGCSVRYSAIAPDHIYKSGADIGIIGIFKWLLAPNVGIGFTSQLYAVDIDSKRLDQSLSFKVEHGFASVNAKVLEVEIRNECDDPTGYCGVSGMGAAVDTMEAYMDGGERVAFGYTRKKGGKHVVIPLKPLNPEQSTKLTQCMLKVMTAYKSAKG